MAVIESSSLVGIRIALAAAPRWLGILMLGLCAALNVSIYCVQKVVNLQDQKMHQVTMGVLGSTVGKLSDSDQSDAVDVAVSALEGAPGDMQFYTAALWLLSAAGFVCFVLGIEIITSRSRRYSGLVRR